MGAQALGDRVAHRGARVERRERVLEHDLHLAAQQVAELSPLAARTSMPSNVMLPLSASSSRSSTRPSVDLPHPDSPTSPSTSPARMSRSTPSTACTTPLALPNASGPGDEGLDDAAGFEQDVAARSLTIVLDAAAFTVTGVSATSECRKQRTLCPGATSTSAGQLLGAPREAGFDAGLAARREAAARRQVDEVGHPPGDHRQLLGPPADHRARTRSGPGCRDAAAR